MPSWYWPKEWITSSTASTTAATNTAWWSNALTASTTSAWTNMATTSGLYQQQGLLQQMYAQQAQQTAMAYHQQPMSPWQLYESGTCSGLGSLFTPSRPAIITRQDEARRDRELYRRAMEEHNEQEAARLLRLVERHEQLDADQRRIADQQRQIAHEEQQRRQAAKDRARELLVEHLTPQQRETFDANGWFVVEGGRSKTQYRIRAVESMVANVDVLNKAGSRTHRLCAHVQIGTVPLGDQLLAQKVMIELAEDDFLRVANRHAA